MVRRAYQSLGRGILLQGELVKRHELLNINYVNLCKRNDTRLEELNQLRNDLQGEMQASGGYSKKLSLLETAHTSCSDRKLEEVIELKSKQLSDVEGQIQVLKSKKSVLVAKLAQAEMDRQKIVKEFILTVVNRLHSRVEYQKSLAFPIGLCFTAGWLGGLCLGKEEEEIAKKFANSFRLPLDALIKISSDVPHPTLGNGAGPSVENNGDDSLASLRVGMPILAGMTTSLPYMRLKGVLPLLVFSIVRELRVLLIWLSTFPSPHCLPQTRRLVGKLPVLIIPLPSVLTPSSCVLSGDRLTMSLCLIIGTQKGTLVMSEGFHANTYVLSLSKFINWSRHAGENYVPIVILYSGKAGLTEMSSSKSFFSSSNTAFFPPDSSGTYIFGCSPLSDVISKVVYAMCKKCLISVNYDKCLSKYVNGKNSCGKNQKAKISVKEIQKKYKPKVSKPKKKEGKLVDSSESKSKSDCSNGNLKLFINFVWKFFGTVRFENDHVAAILGFGDLQWGNILITRVYFVEGLGHNLFSVGQFCDSDLERLSHLNFDTINDLARNDLVAGLLKFKYHKEHLCPSYEQGKTKRASYPPKPVPNSRQRLHLLYMDLCGLMRIASINGKRTDNGTQFKNQVLKDYFDTVGISHQMSSVRTPQQNGVAER
nr:retrovirus-related Pol polyprotein from transposon TNT 1-94 [Tanacetum cinerariifolium]